MNSSELSNVPQMPTQSAGSDLQAVLANIVGPSQYEIFPRSTKSDERGIYFLVRSGIRKQLAMISNDTTRLAKFHGGVHRWQEDGRTSTLMLCPLDSQNAAALREVLPWLQPRVLGLRKSFGCGDRLGLATPGHVRAMRLCEGRVAPIFAQQSIREMMRTARTPQQVLDDAMWGVFQEGWDSGYGADADHLKTCEDIDACVAAGFTFYTFDPGAYVDDDSALSDEKLDALPWAELETIFADVRARYVGRRVAFERLTLELDDASVRGALIKYGRAVAHVTRLFRHLQSVMHRQAFEVEISVDETATPTSPSEHFVFAGELRRLGVEWASLAPRFVGRFEKGVEYIGSLDGFEGDFAAHAEVAKYWGPYKLSLHSGSDKFSIFGPAARLAGDLVHLKTAGTSYLEALRTIARLDPDLFRRIYGLANARYGEERASYHVSADLTRVPIVDKLADSELVTILDQFDARQVLHVCFGSILAQYGEEVREALTAHEEVYYGDLQRHFARHLESFCM
jgi:tagaturonate epimerase